MWAAAIVVLLPTLAWLQYSWLDQVADADRNRRERTVRTAAAQLAQEFDLELSKALFALQADSTILEPRSWPAYAERYGSWSSSAANPRMVHSIYLASAASPGSPASSLPVLRQWNHTAQRFDTASWPAELSELAARLGPQLNQSLPNYRGRFGRGERPPLPLLSDDPGILIGPIVRIDPEPTVAADRASRAQMVGFTIVRLDLAVLSREMLPVFIKRHFADETGHSDFRVAVVKRDTPADVVFESEPGAAVMAAAAPDATMPLMTAHGRPFFVVTRDGSGMTAVTLPRSGSLTPPPPPPPAPGDDRLVVNVIEARRDDRTATIRTRMTGPGGDGYWRLVAQHRAGSLEAAVASARTRNLAVSSGVLLLLSAAIGLIIVSARRADRLGRQQMEFVATVSHEFRTPVSVIGAAAGNLADGIVSDPERVRRYGATIQVEARRLGETVERVLQLAGIASGRAMTRSAIQASQLVSDSLEACRAEIEAAGFTVEVDIPKPLPAIAGDGAALRSALQNVIGNAVKYGGDARWLGISARAAGHEVAITVADRGPGIADADRAHIFEAFYRGRQAVTEQIQGSGLGLHLVQRIVAAHGGQVTVACGPGPGCRFTLTLPVAPAAAAPEPGRRAEVADTAGAARQTASPQETH